MKFYRVRKRLFWRPIPSAVAERFQELRKDKTVFNAALGRIEGRLNELCRTPLSFKARATVAKLIQSLVTHGEVWLKIPWAVAETAFRPRTGSGKYPGPRHYVHVGEGLVRKCETLLRIYDSSFRMPTYWPVKAGVGSAFCPETWLVKKLFKKMRTLLRVTARGTTQQMIRKWNALAACSHCLTLLGTGLRNGSLGGIPNRLLSSKPRTEFVFQKERIFAYQATPPLQRILKQVQGVWHQVKSRLLTEGIRIRNDQSTRFIYGFLTSETDSTYRWNSPSPAMVKEGFAGLVSTQSYCFWERTWTRHFSNTVLRELGYSEVEVRTYMGHHESALDSLRRHRLELLLSSSRIAMVANLLKVVGF